MQASLKDVKLETGDRTDKWIDCAKRGQTPLPYILNRTEAMLENEMREIIIAQLKVYRNELNYTRYPNDKTIS